MHALIRYYHGGPLFKSPSFLSPHYTQKLLAPPGFLCPPFYLVLYITSVSLSLFPWRLCVCACVCVCTCVFACVLESEFIWTYSYKLGEVSLWAPVCNRIRKLVHHMEWVEASGGNPGRQCISLLMSCLHLTIASVFFGKALLLLDVMHVQQYGVEEKWLA